MRWTRERVGYGLIGLGVGGLVDGFVLHQLLQCHHPWSVYDSVFAAIGVAVTAVGWVVARPPRTPGGPVPARAPR